MKSRRRGPMLAAVAAAAVAAYLMAWQWDFLPREVAGTGSLILRDGTILKTRQSYRTRHQQGHKSPPSGPAITEPVWEVELPSGRWVDCDPDCQAAAENARK